MDLEVSPISCCYHISKKLLVFGIIKQTELKEKNGMTRTEKLPI